MAALIPIFNGQRYFTSHSPQPLVAPLVVLIGVSAAASKLKQQQFTIPRQVRRKKKNTGKQGRKVLLLARPRYRFI